MNTILEFIHTNALWLAVATIGPAALWIANRMDKDAVAFVMSELEVLRSKLNSTEIGSQIDVDDAIITILESYIPECVHELDETVKAEVKNGNFSSLDWVELGKNLWEKGRVEICGGAVNYWEVSGKKDQEAVAALIAKKFFHKQAALQQGLLVPHN